MNEYLQWFYNNMGITIIGAITLIQIAPIKIDPWKAIVKMISKWLMEETNEKVDNLAKEIGEVQKAGNVRYVNATRWEILSFSNSCRRNGKHTREEWEHIIQQLKEYEEFINANNITNGVIEQETEFLRDLYKEILRKNDFLAG